MRLVIHDLTGKDDISFGDSLVISDNGSIKPCKGCFGCWIKTPGRCIIHDGYENMGEYISKCDRLTVISRCVFGSLSPFVKNVLDRSISYIHPFFEIRNGEMHHKRRYENRLRLDVYMYGDTTEEERRTAEKLVKAEALNLCCETSEIHFIKSVKGEAQLLDIFN